jgi:hypothetical protein
MRILALLFTAWAVFVWWAPLPRFAQTTVLLCAALLVLALRSVWKRLNAVREASPEAGGAGQEPGP